MTTTVTAPACPKCGGAMWDQKAGKFPYKPGTPIFKCKDKECATNGGVIWEPKNGAIPTPSTPKSAPAKQPISYQNVPDSALPPLLRNQQAEDDAELYAKVGGKSDIPEPILKQREAYATAQFQTLQIALQVLEPEYRKAEIGLTDDVVHKHAFELLKLWSDKGLI